MARLIETTDNRIYRVVADLGAHFDCVEVKRVKGGYADKANARPQIILKAFVIRQAA